MNCSKCGGVLYTGTLSQVLRHESNNAKECPPLFQVWCPAEHETEEGASSFRGDDEEGAARYDCHCRGQRGCALQGAPGLMAMSAHRGCDGSPRAVILRREPATE